MSNNQNVPAQILKTMYDEVDPAGGDQPPRRPEDDQARPGDQEFFLELDEAQLFFEVIVIFVLIYGGIVASTIWVILTFL